MLVSAGLPTLGLSVGVAIAIAGVPLIPPGRPMNERVVDKCWRIVPIRERKRY
jgi:hypothetical protein